MIDLSKQQRWVIIIIVGALLVGMGILAVRYFTQGSRSEQVIDLDNGETNVEEASGRSAEGTSKAYVHVCGQVRKPGVYQLPMEARVFQAVEAAGGVTEEADQSAVNLAAHITDGEQIYLPKIGESARIPIATGKKGHQSNKAVQPQWPLDLNRASAGQLDFVPGIGPSMASRIIEYREQNGSFTSLDDLTQVPGIGEKKLARFRQYLCVR
jgi:competence protein ComEA